MKKKEAATMARSSKRVKISVQVVPKSGRMPKPKSAKVSPGMSAEQVLKSLGIGLAGRKLSFGGKPIAAADALYEAGTSLKKGTVLRVEEHAQGS